MNKLEERNKANMIISAYLRTRTKDDFIKEIGSELKQLGLCWEIVDAVFDRFNI